MHVMTWLESIPTIVIYLVVGVTIGMESVGIPLPGEIMLVSGSVAASQGVITLNPVLLAAVAAGGAILGDSLGYLIGRRYGRTLLGWMGRRAPKHFGPGPIAKAERIFARWGAWAVFGGRFVALLRILAGPLAGVLGMPYRRFLIANAAGGIIWASTVTTVGYVFGLVAGHWLRRASSITLGIAIVAGVVIAVYVRRRRAKGALAEEETVAEAKK